MNNEARPGLSPGQKIEVAFCDPEPRWVAHEFVEWADAPMRCLGCGRPIAHPRMLVRGNDGTNIVVDYTDAASWRALREVGKG